MKEKLLPDHPVWGFPALPKWCWDRPEQWEMQVELAQQIVGVYRDNIPVVFLQGPTGTGKSLVAELVRRLMFGSRMRQLSMGGDSEGVSELHGGRTSYTCTTKSLQDQLAGSFTYAAVLKGRANYLTEKGKVNEWGQPTPTARYSAITCADCTYSFDDGCRWCSSTQNCPYGQAKEKARQSDLSILNTAYLLTDLNLGGRYFKDRGLYVLDECDLLEEDLLNTVEVSISARRMERIGLDYPAKKTVEEAWIDWVDYALPVVRGYHSNLPSLSAENTSIGERREKKGIAELIGKMVRLQREIKDGGWIYDGYNEGSVVFKPVKVDGYGEEYLWRLAKNGAKFLLMSATIISAEEMAATLGYYGAWELIDAPMTYDVRNRPIHVLSMADMRNSWEGAEKEAVWDKCLTAVRGCCRLHPGERVLVHTVSYRLAEFLYEGLRDELRDVYVYLSATDREVALADFQASEGSVLVAASMERGIDLPGDACTVQVVAKTPFGNLGDKRTGARLRTEGGQAWYDVKTVRSIVQMTGRAIRGPDDKAVTYVVDSNFATNLLRNNRQLFPTWWLEAVNMRYPVARIRKLGDWEITEQD